MMKLPTGIVGNTGLYYACYRLSALGWNVMPTARNTRGIDIVCFSVDGKTVRTIQVKSLTKAYTVPLGTDIEKIMGDFWVIVNSLGTDHPRALHLAAPRGTGLGRSQPPRKTGVLATAQEVRRRCVRGAVAAHWPTLKPVTTDSAQL